MKTYEIFHEICGGAGCGSCGQLTGLPIAKCGPGIKLCRSSDVYQYTSACESPMPIAVAMRSGFDLISQTCRSGGYWPRSSTEQT